MKKILLGLLVCAGFSACTNDDVVLSGVDVQKTFDGDVAYMTVRINDVGSGTRATEGNYKNGSAAEYAVSDAYFYFYDNAGVFVSEAEVWDGGEAVTGDTNIEFEGNTVIVLKGLTGTGYPNYVVTVLNKPSGFTPGPTLADMATLLADANGVGIIQTPATTSTAATNFTMSTSSYVGDEPYYFVTPITEDDFFEEPIDMDEVVPVDIYVERLAAKVGTDIDSELANTATTIGGKTGYKLTETIAGDENEQDAGSDEGDEDIYVVINGWALNGTAKHSNMVKDIDDTWTNEGLGFTWNIPSDYRSYWGKSFNYGLGFGQYPTSSEGATDGTTVNEWLDYVSYNQLDYDMGDSEYCAENTNTAGGAGDASAIIQTKNTAAITNVLISATVCDAEGNPLDLVRYQGELFTKDAFLNYVMTLLKTTGAAEWNVYTLDSTSGDEVYTQIDASYITLGKTITSDGNTLTRYDGYIVVLADEDAFTADAYYYNTGETDTEGNPIYAAYESVAAAIAAVNGPLYTFDSTYDNINAYTGGAMYYHVPIEHLNNNVAVDSEGNATGVPYEANYGIVRNHWYQLTVTSIENLGKGVFDPDEVIIPNIDDDQYYYVGAEINILSWKLVNQNVDL